MAGWIGGCLLLLEGLLLVINGIGYEIASHAELPAGLE